jgi:hypothetical protein
LIASFLLTSVALARNQYPKALILPLPSGAGHLSGMEGGLSSSSTNKSGSTAAEGLTLSSKRAFVDLAASVSATAQQGLHTLGTRFQRNRHVEHETEVIPALCPDSVPDTCLWCAWVMVSFTGPPLLWHPTLVWTSLRPICCSKHKLGSQICGWTSNLVPLPPRRISQMGTSHLFCLIKSSSYV